MTVSREQLLRQLAVAQFCIDWPSDAISRSELEEKLDANIDTIKNDLIDLAERAGVQQILLPGGPGRGNKRRFAAGAKDALRPVTEALRRLLGSVADA